MRLDKYLTGAGIMSRKECAIAVKKGSVRIDGEIAKRPDTQVIPGKSIVEWEGQTVDYRENW